MTHKQTMGVHGTYEPGLWGVSASFYYQMGKRGTPTKAWMASINGHYTVNDEWQVNGGYDLLSGQNDDDKSGVQHAFDPLFGSHHMFYGAMDLFFTSPWGYKPKGFFTTTQELYAPGLQDFHLGAICKAIPVKGLVAKINYHYFASAAKLSKSIRGLGHEIDLQATIPLMKDVKLHAGYSFILNQNTMDIVKGGYHKSWQDWAWITFDVSTRLLSRKL